MSVGSRDVRLQLDVSVEARRNLRVLAVHDDRSMSYTLDRILVNHVADLAHMLYGGRLEDWRERFCTSTQPKVENDRAAAGEEA